MSLPVLPESRDDFVIAIDCQLPNVSRCVEALLDRKWEDNHVQYGRAPADTNRYTLGLIGQYNVVLVHRGSSDASNIAAGLQASFRNIRLVFMVGVADGVPLGPGRSDIFLGDVATHLEDTSSRERFSIRAVLAKLEPRFQRKALEIAAENYMQHLHQTISLAQYPGATTDKLYDPSYSHKHHEATECEECAQGDSICAGARAATCSAIECSEAHLKRVRAVTDATLINPKIHCGPIGLDGPIIESGIVRDDIAKKDDIIAYSSESAVITETFPSVVIQGIGGYMDGHHESHWPDYAASTATACLKALLKQLPWPDIAIEHGSKSSAFWFVPDTKIHRFFGRRAQLETIEGMLNRQSKLRATAIVGLGGMGKTQLALELAHRLRAQDAGMSVFWINAWTRSTFEADVLKIERLLKPRGTRAENVEVGELFRKRLSKWSTGRWLLILDGVDDLNLHESPTDSDKNSTSLIETLPISENGAVIITTRSQNVASRLAGDQVVVMQGIDKGDACAMLESLILDPDALANYDDVSMLVERLQMPLAIAQAAAYINEYHITVTEFLKRLDHRQSELMERFDDTTETSSTSLAALGSALVSINSLELQEPLATKILVLMTQLSPDCIPSSLLLSIDRKNDVVHAIETLVSCGLIQRCADTEHMTLTSYSVHVLVRQAVHLRSTESSVEDQKETVLVLLNSHFPNPSHDNRSDWEHLLPHVNHVLSSTSPEVHIDAHHALLLKTGMVSEIEGKYAESAKAYRAIIEWRKERFDSTDLITLEAYVRLGVVLDLQGYSAEAETYITTAVEFQKDLLSNDDPNMWHSWMGLVSIFWRQGRFTQAEELLEMIIQSVKKTKGSDHILCLICKSKLGLLYLDQNQLDLSENILTEVLGEQRLILGNDHSATLETMNNLASVFHKQSRYNEAEALMTQTCNILVRVLGTRHPDTLNAMSNLAAIFFDEGYYEKAEILLQQTLQLRVDVLGRQHPHTLQSMSNLASSYTVQKRYGEAFLLYSTALEIARETQGAEHPNTLNMTANLASVLQAQGKLSEAEDLQNKVLEVRKRNLGTEHVSVLESMGSISSILAEKGRQEDADELSIHIMVLCKKTLDAANPIALRSLTNYGKILLSTGRLVAGEELLMQVLQKQKEFLSNGHSDLIETITTLKTSLTEHETITEAQKAQPVMQLLYLSTLQFSLISGHQQLGELILRDRIDWATTSSESFNDILYHAAKGGHRELAESLINRGVVGLDSTMPQDESALIVASAEGHENIVELLLDSGANVNLVCRGNGTALHAASARGQVVIVQLLIKYGAQINLSCERYGSPLHAAYIHGHEEVVRILLDKGANINAEFSPYFGTPLRLVPGNPKLTRFLLDWMARFPSKLSSGTAEAEEDEDDGDDERQSISTASLSSFSESDISSPQNNLSRSTSGTTQSSSSAIGEPEEIYTILTRQILLHPNLKQLEEEILAHKGRTGFFTIFVRSIKRFCQMLSTEASNPLQRRAIRLLRRRRPYFAYQVTNMLDFQHLYTKTSILNLPSDSSTAVEKVEGYLKSLGTKMSREAELDTPIILANESVEYATPTTVLHRSQQESGDPEYLETNEFDLDDIESEGSENETGQDGVKNPSMHHPSMYITDETISWLRDSSALRNLVYELTRESFAPMQYIDRVLQFALPASLHQSVNLNLSWDMVDYIKEQLEDVEQLHTVLTISGAETDAEASTCLEYCQKNWPVDGPAVLKAIQEAIRNTALEARNIYDLPSGASLSLRLSLGKDSSKNMVLANLKGARADVIKTSQQLAWLTTVLRVPSDRRLSSSAFSIKRSVGPDCFVLVPEALKPISRPSSACWHAIFQNWVLAEGFPIQPRNGEKGIEISFAAMVHLAEVLGPVTYEEGVVLKGISSILFPVQAPVLSTDWNNTSAQWHLIRLPDQEFASLSMLDQFTNRWRCQVDDLEKFLACRTFLGCYKKVKVLLATRNYPYSLVEYSQSHESTPKPRFSGFSAGISAVFHGVGVSGSANYTIPNHALIKKDFGPYEQALAYCSVLPVILYDTLSHRAWMVPALSVILHMTHIWYHNFKDDFPSDIEAPPFVDASSNIAAETLKVMKDKTSFKLYTKLTNNEPYSLGDKVASYCLKFQELLASTKHHKGINADELSGWDLMEVLSVGPSVPKTPHEWKFKGNWRALAQNPEMIVLLGHNLGDIIVPEFEDQRSIHYFPNTKPSGGLGRAQNNNRFTDCSHDEKILCQRGQKLWCRAEITLIVQQLEEEGAIVFGDGHNKIKKSPRND